ncbi:PREDICTED: E3 ubiquitin-protein ligase RNF13 isoform X2 [Galeopterus variegatus]|uniref:E3 ubiquitin-protein ligase RNF13 isoform X2 n=1 Tax=Galeopterus variegatus TaxID=482537 RepID=A0ABM0S830_GALVR|nr:PREDICTED: E3 ubiquitin-protein ligase RNF13 isoform X2 [Galeopterus variegatus]
MLLSIGMLMLSATQVYTILTVQLFAFLNLLPVEADILAYNFENASQTFDDLPARFGYRLPAEGLKRKKIQEVKIMGCRFVLDHIILKIQNKGFFD